MEFRIWSSSRSLVTSLRSLLIIMRHLQPRPLISTLHIEALIRLAAVQNALVAANLPGDIVEGLDHPQTQFFALLVLRHSDIFYVSHETEVVNEFPLDDHTASAHDCFGGVADHKDVVSVVPRGHEVVACVKLFGRYLADGC